jgi:hypothetical protein
VSPVDHAPGAHDDLSNSVAGAIVSGSVLGPENDDLPVVIRSHGAVVSIVNVDGVLSCGPHPNRSRNNSRHFCSDLKRTTTFDSSSDENYIATITRSMAISQHAPPFAGQICCSVIRCPIARHAATCSEGEEWCSPRNRSFQQAAVGSRVRRNCIFRNGLRRDIIPRPTGGRLTI